MQSSLPSSQKHKALRQCREREGPRVRLGTQMNTLLGNKKKKKACLLEEGKFPSILPSLTCRWSAGPHPAFRIWPSMNISWNFCYNLKTKVSVRKQAMYQSFFLQNYSSFVNFEEPDHVRFTFPIFKARPFGTR